MWRFYFTFFLYDRKLIASEDGDWIYFRVSYCICKYFFCDVVCLVLYDPTQVFSHSHKRLAAFWNKVLVISIIIIHSDQMKPLFTAFFMQVHICHLFHYVVLLTLLKLDPLWLQLALVFVIICCVLKLIYFLFNAMRRGRVYYDEGYIERLPFPFHRKNSVCELSVRTNFLMTLSNI